MELEWTDRLWLASLIERDLHALYERYRPAEPLRSLCRLAIQDRQHRHASRNQSVA